MLFDARKFEQGEPHEVTLKERAFMANGDFDYWFRNGSGFSLQQIQTQNA